MNLVVISAGTGNPSSTRQLADRIAQKALDLLDGATVSTIELGPLAVDTARAAVADFPGPELQAAIDKLAAADAIVAATPVYKAGLSGLFKTFVDVLDNDLMSPSRCCSRPRAGRRATRSSSTTRCGRCSPTCAR
jgi:FMN reductase